MVQKLRLTLMAACAVLSLSLPAAAAQVGVVTASGTLNFRTGPTTEATVVDRLPGGTKVAVLEQSSEWHKIAVNGQAGYVSAAYLAVSGDNASVSVGSGTISGSVVNLRAGPGTASAVLAKLPRGTAVQVDGIQNGWFQVTAGDTAGYVHSDYVAFCAAAAGGGLTADSPVVAAAGGTQAADIIAYARQYLGTPYKAGGASPSGFDCSGFTYYIFKHFDIALSRSSSAQLSNCYTELAKEALIPGDLVFFKNPNASKSIGHVGIYIGDGSFIHATSPGKPVSIDTMLEGYYYKYYITAGRIL